MSDQKNKRALLKQERDRKRAANRQAKKELRQKAKANRKRRRQRQKHGLNFALHNRPIKADDYLYGCVAGLDKKKNPKLKRGKQGKHGKQGEHAEGGEHGGHGEGHHWTYEGETGPAHWSEMGFEEALGKEQSPINIVKTAVKDVKLPSLDIDYEDEDATIINNGHTIQVNWPSGTLEIGEKDYELLQFHFHSPSEHTINGKHFPLEMHLVHQAEDGELAVLAVLFKAKGDAPNEFLEQFWDCIPTEPMKEGDMPIPLGEIDAYDLQLSIKKHFRYNGSLTTPPCTEGVVWTILEKPERCSPAQVQHFKNILKTKTNRPVQPLHDRTVLV